MRQLMDLGLWPSLRLWHAAGGRSVGMERLPASVPLGISTMGGSSAASGKEGLG